jgi:hypothetical protein
MRGEFSHADLAVKMYPISDDCGVWSSGYNQSIQDRFPADADSSLIGPFCGVSGKTVELIGTNDPAEMRCPNALANRNPCGIKSWNSAHLLC